MTPETLSRLQAARAASRPVALLTHLADGAQILFPEDAAPEALAAAAAAALRSDEASPHGAWFVQPFNPSLRLIVVGAVHVAQSLAPLAAAMGFAVTVLDPRRAFATPDRFPGVQLHHAWPDDGLAELGPDARTAVVTLTHDPKLDDPALEAALRSPAFYVGALGSRRTHAKRAERLREAGFGEADIARIAAPVGLDIGARTAPEIALSVVAQVVARRRGR